MRRRIYNHFLEYYPEDIDECLKTVAKENKTTVDDIVDILSSSLPDVISPDVEFEMYKPISTPKLKAITGDFRLFLSFLREKYTNVCVPRFSSDTVYYFSWDSSVLALALGYASMKELRRVWIFSTNEKVDDVKRLLEKCPKRFFVLGITLEGEVSNHQNILIFDTEKKRMEIYDPHGQERFTYFKHDILEKEIQKLFLDFTLIKVADLCPKKSFQSVEAYNMLTDVYYNKIVKLYGKPGLGFCQAWSIFYLELRLKYPNLNQKRLQEKALEKLKQGNLTEFIIGYIEYMSRKFDLLK